MGMPAATRRPRLAPYAAAMSLLLAAPPPSSMADERERLAAIEGAKLMAQRALAESAGGVRLAVLPGPGGQPASVSARTDGRQALRGASFDKIEYDPADGLAIVHASLQGKPLAELMGSGRTDAALPADLAIRRMGAWGASPSAQRKAQALRAAELDAYRLLLGKLRALQAAAGSTVGQAADASEAVRRKLTGVLFAADLAGFRLEGTPDAPVAFVSLRLDTRLLAGLGPAAPASAAGVLSAEGRGLPCGGPAAAAAGFDPLGKPGESAVAPKDFSFTPAPPP